MFEVGNGATGTVWAACREDHSTDAITALGRQVSDHRTSAARRSRHGMAVTWLLQPSS